MTEDALYPEPPHLTIAVWSPEDEESVFGRACDVVVELGCAPAGVVELAPRGQRYALLQDLEGRSTTQLAPDAFESAVHGGDPALRPLKAGYRVKGWGTVIVEHLLGTEEETHPVAVSLAADVLGLPESLWNAKDRKAAAKLADWAADVLRELATHCGAVYGALGVEETLPTPSALRSGAPIGMLPFISSKLPDAVHDQFRTAFAPVQSLSWAAGDFFPGWQPSSPGRTNIDKRSLTAASIALGHAAVQ